MKLLNFRKHLIILSILLTADLRAENNLSGYFKVEAGQESNILESDSTSQSSCTVPLITNLNYRRNMGRLSLNINSTSGLMMYNYSRENKATLNIQTHLKYTFKRTVSFSSSASTFNKWWLQQDYAYNNSDLWIGLSFNKNRLTSTFSLGLGTNSYQSRSNLNNRQIGGVLDFTYQINPGLSLVMQNGLIKSSYFDRPVYVWHSIQFDTLSNQRDQFTFMQLGIEWRRRALCGLRLRVLNFTSNNNYAEYYGASLNYYLSGKIGKGYFQVVSDVLLKKYRADLSRYLLDYNPDPEQNIQNQLLLGWEWPLWKHLAITGRAAVIRNETHYSGLYYNKWFFSGGLIYRID
jgi:hypothetical protein